MNISEKLTGIQNSRNTIRTKIAELGLGDGTEKLDTCAEKISSIGNKGTVAIEVKEGESKNLEPGYYKGGTVTGVGGGGNYTLESGREVTPTKEDQTIAPGEGYYGMSGVTVKAIPAQYQDVSDVTATEETVLSPNVFVDKEGTVRAGTMPNNGAVVGQIDGLSNTSYTIPKGYHDGNGTVSLTDDIEKALAAI